ncbi:MAG TPA: M20 family metallopeptidase [Anaerovoracaceae bacterium]|nr:M20 family metallopeptidase [Anaerovoracaceae bacterium]
MEDAVSKKITNYFSEQETIDLLAKLVSFPSHEGIENQETEVAKYIYDFFIREGFEAELIPVEDGRCNVIARMRGTGEGKTLLFTGHTDTVPPYDMPGNPYEVKFVNGDMFGRGVLDMKAGLACMMMAMTAIKRAGIKLSGDLVFAALIDEEAKSLGTRAWLQSCSELPDAAIVSEPTNMEICVGHRGLEWFEFTFHGKTVHGGRQKEGINAIQKATMFLNRLENDLIPRIEKKMPHPIIGSPSMNYGLIRGGTQPSTVAGECILQLDRRWIPGENFKDIVREYQKIIDELSAEDPKFKADIKVMEISYMDDKYVHEAMDTDPGEAVVKVTEKAIEDVTGSKAVMRSFTAWTDGGLINYYGKVPTIVLGPGELEYAHSATEHISIGSIVPAVLVYASIACEYCK